MPDSTIKLSQNLSKIAKQLDKIIEHYAGERIGFSLLVFTEGRASYIGNWDRKESIKQLRTLLDLWEKGMPDIKAHEVM